MAAANVGGQRPPLQHWNRVAVRRVHRPTGPRLQLGLHFFPDALFLLPVVERFAVDFVNGSFSDGQFIRLDVHEEIDVVDFAVGAFHIDTGEIFVPAQTREPIVMYFDQVQREILTLKWDVKLLIGGFC